MTVGGRSTLEKNPLPDSSGNGVGLGFLALAPSAPKLFGFGRDAARHLPAASVRWTSALFVSANTGIARWLSL